MANTGPAAFTLPFAYVELPFDKDGNVTPIGPIDGTNARADLRALAAKIDDLIVISHGWNNDVNDARALYAGFLGSVNAQWGDAKLSDADRVRTGVLAIYWPSKKFDEPGAVTGGAAAIDDAEPDYGALIDAQIANLQDADGQLTPLQKQLLDEARTASKTLDDPAARDAFVVALAKLWPAPHEIDPGLDALNVAGAQAKGGAILADIATSLGGTPPPVGDGTGGAASIGAIGDLGAGGASDAGGAGMTGGAAGFDPIAQAKQAAWLLLNCTTYYVMKERAGTIGSVATPIVLDAIAANPNVRVHLVGHSFGGRLVTSLANGLPNGGPRARTMTLLQAAYSHYGLAPDGTNHSPDHPIGAFRSIVDDGKVTGLIQITHSNHDWPVGVGYDIASAFMRQVAAFITVPSTANSRYGGMGANGAQDTPEASDMDLLEAGGDYPAMPAKSTIRNLNGSSFIMGHGDVRGKEVAWAFLHAFTEARA